MVVVFCTKWADISHIELLYCHYTEEEYSQTHRLILLMVAKGKEADRYPGTGILPNIWE